MDQTVSDTRRSKLYDQLADLMIDALGRGAIPLKEAQSMSKQILEKLDNVKLESELLAFVEALCEKWNIYRPTFVGLKVAHEEAKSQEKIEELQKKIAQYMN